MKSMRRPLFVTAILAALAFSACGSGEGENAGNTSDGSADMEISADSRSPEEAIAAVKEPGSVQSQAGSQEQDRSIMAEQEGYAGMLQVTLPEGWTYDACPQDSEQLRVGDYGIHFYPENASEGFIELCYVDFFGVCGTGLEEEQVTLAGDPAYVGTYDQNENWDFVSFRGTRDGIVALTFGVEGWWPEYGEQVMGILETVCLERELMDGAVPESGTDAGLSPSALQDCKTALPTVACGTSQEPPEDRGQNTEADSRIEELGLSLEVTECTGTGATLVFRQSGGNPTGELIFGDDYCIQRYENGEWADVPVAIKGNYGFHAVAYIIAPGEDREFQIDWEWLYGELGSGKYRIRKGVDDFRKTADYDEYEIYAYFEILS